MNKGIGGIIADYGKDDSFTRIAPTERMLEKNTGTQGTTRLPSCDTPQKVRAPASHRDSALRHHQRRPPSRPPHNRNPDVLIETIRAEPQHAPLREERIGEPHPIDKQPHPVLVTDL